jgi:hypothetical protein
MNGGVIGHQRPAELRSAWTGAHTSNGGHGKPRSYRIVGVLPRADN